MKNRILIISAHPDDDILGCGGAMSRYKDKADIKVVFIAEGSTCRFNDGNSDEAKTAIKVRNQYGRDALALLDITDIEFSNFPCGQLDQISQLVMNKIIEKEIKLFQPSTIFTHWHHDNNTDHRKVHDATMIAARPGVYEFVKNIYAYEVLSSTEWNFKQGFQPNFFIPLTKTNVDEKIKAMMAYESEMQDYPYPRSIEGIETQAKIRGMQIGTKYAEGFILLRGEQL